MKTKNKVITKAKQGVPAMKDLKATVKTEWKLSLDELYFAGCLCNCNSGGIGVSKGLN